MSLENMTTIEKRIAAQQRFDLENDSMLNGEKAYYVTLYDRDGPPGRVHFFADQSRITISEMNHILANHDAQVLEMQTNYGSEECLYLRVLFRDTLRLPRGNAACGTKLAWSVKWNRNSECRDDLTFEDGAQMLGSKLYCVSGRTKNEKNAAHYLDNQVISIPELNHVLGTHSCTVRKMRPVYGTGTELFVLISFSDPEIPKPWVPASIRSQKAVRGGFGLMRSLGDAKRAQWRYENDNTWFWDGESLRFQQLLLTAPVRKCYENAGFFANYSVISNEEMTMLLSAHRSQTLSSIQTQIHDTGTLYLGQFVLMQFQDEG